jgi:hypothetical protein
LAEALLHPYNSTTGPVAAFHPSHAINLFELVDLVVHNIINLRVERRRYALLGCNLINDYLEGFESVSPLSFNELKTRSWE